MGCAIKVAVAISGGDEGGDGERELRAGGLLIYCKIQPLCAYTPMQPVKYPRKSGLAFNDSWKRSRRGRGVGSSDGGFCANYVSHVKYRGERFRFFSLFCGGSEICGHRLQIVAGTSRQFSGKKLN